MFAGQMACEALNFGLKRLIQEERPQRMRLFAVVTPPSTAANALQKCTAKATGCRHRMLSS